MKIDLAFNEANDGRFLVLCVAPDLGNSAPSITTFEDENPFLADVVQADLTQDELIDVVTTVLLSISKPAFPQRWVTIDVSEAQLTRLGLPACKPSLHPVPPRSIAGAYKMPAWNFESSQHFHDFLMQAPTPFVMLQGPDHLLTFINPPFLALIGRSINRTLVGLPIRECLPELEGQPFFNLLDQVYRTGTPFVGKEIPGRLQNQRTGAMKDHFFDFVYHPTLDAVGDVFGIFVQAFDVTDTVLARQVSQSREEKLYRQWAELDTIYRTSPVAMCLVEAREYRILRINDRLANLTGETVENLLGQNLLDVFPRASGSEEALRKAAAGHYVRNVDVATSVNSMPGVLRHWLANFGPLRGANGQVEAIACVSFEVTDLVRDEAPDQQSEDMHTLSFIDRKL